MSRLSGQARLGFSLACVLSFLILPPSLPFGKSTAFYFTSVQFTSSDVRLRVTNILITVHDVHAPWVRSCSDVRANFQMYFYEANPNLHAADPYQKEKRKFSILFFFFYKNRLFLNAKQLKARQYAEWLNLPLHVKFWSVSNVHEDWQIQQWRDESGRVSFERITRKNAGDFISFAVIHHDFMCMQYHVLIGSGLCTCKLYIIKFCALCKPYWLFFAVLCVRVCVCFGACLHQVTSGVKFCTKRSQDATNKSLHRTRRWNSLLIVLWIKRCFFDVSLNVFTSSKRWLPNHLTTSTAAGTIHFIFDKQKVCLKRTRHTRKVYMVLKSVNLMQNFLLTGLHTRKVYRILKSVSLTQNFLLKALHVRKVYRILTSVHRISS